MTKASDNAFPSVLITEGTEPAAPAAGKQRVYIDSTSHHLKRTDSSGTDVDIETASAGAPSTAKYIVGAADGTLSQEVVNEALWDNYQPDKYPGSPATEDDEFEGGGAIDAKWTKTNDPASGDAWNQTTYPGYARVGLVELGTDNVANYVLLTQTAPTGTATARYRIKFCIGISGVASTDSGEFAQCTVGLIDIANGIATGAGVQYNNADTGDVIRGVPQHDTAGTPGNMATIDVNNRWSPGEFIYAELRKDTASAYTSANTYTAWLSKDGVVWQQIGSASVTFTATPVVGIMVRRPKSQTGTPAGEVAIDFFRKVA